MPSGTAPLSPRTMPPTSELSGHLGGSPYAKELRLLRYILASVRPEDGCPRQVCDAMEGLGKKMWASQSLWSKVAGASKAAVLCSALRGAPSERSVLEIGTYCGYTSLHMAMALPDVAITTLEVDPVHAVVARNVFALAGVLHRIDVWIGHSNYLLGRIACQRGMSSFSAVLMDRWGSQYHEDLALLEHHKLLNPGAVLVCDNVLWTGAACFLWRALKTGNYYTKVLGVKEHATLEDDFMSLSVYCPQKASVQEHMPEQLLRLHRKAEKTRLDIFGGGRGMTSTGRAEFARKMQGEMLEQLLEIGVVPITSS